LWHKRAADAKQAAPKATNVNEAKAPAAIKGTRLAGSVKR